MKKKLLKRVLPMVLALVLVFGSTVFAEETTLVPGKEIQPFSTGDMSIAKQQSKALKKQIVEGTGSVNFQAVTVTTASNFAKLSDPENYDNLALVQSTGDKAYFNFKAPAEGTLYMQIYNVESMKPVAITLNGKSISTNLPSGYYTHGFETVKKTGSYQICVSNATSDDIFAVKAMVIPGGNSFNLNNDWTLAAGNKDNGLYTTYWKVKVGANSLLDVSAYDVIPYYRNTAEQAVKVTLCNSKKKVISAQSSLKKFTLNGKLESGHASYGVAKGTYYVKVQANTPIYAISYGTAKYTTKPGTKKSKATSISKGKSKKAVLEASTSKKTQWYKLKLSKKGTMKINFDGYVAPGTKIKMSLVNSKGKAIKILVDRKKKSGITMSGKVNSYIPAEIVSNGKMKKGTYYVKIEKSSKKSSAAYELSFNK